MSNVNNMYRSPDGIPYYKHPSAVLVAKTTTHLDGMRQFLSEHGDGFEKWLEDPVQLTDGVQLVKAAGQLCYLSFGEKRTWNAQAQDYCDKSIKAQGHGSVLEHVNYTFLLYGIDRAVTHELVRHRAGMAYSQVSQRYVDKTTFVQPYETLWDDEATDAFHKMIKTAVEQYETFLDFADRTAPVKEGESKTERRKRMRSFARRALPNMTEAPIMVSGNVRAWRHVLNMRMAPMADVAIRRAHHPILQTLLEVDPQLFNDFTLSELPDGSISATTIYPKV